MRFRQRVPSRRRTPLYRHENIHLHSGRFAIIVSFMVPLDGDRPVARYLIILDCTDTDEVQTHVHSPSEYRTHDPDIRVTNDNALTGDGRDM